MKKSIIKFLFISILSTFSNFVFAFQHQLSDSTLIETKGKPVEVLEELRSDSQLDYPGDEMEKGGFFGTILAFFALFFQWLNDLFQTSVENFDNILNILYFLATIIILFLIYKLAGSRFAWLLGKKDKGTSLGFSVSEENIHIIDYDKEILKAIKENEYRIAIRLVYLRSLKLLSDKDIIHWQEGKTDYEYLLEMKDEGMKSHFEKLSFHFNYVWYGHFEAGKAVFEQAEEQYHKISQHI
ncbi:MAG: hypothetical protein OEW75_03535 [Cyclobacteriaceae bacterium]|nr:hypothetical protein [Cyclobacteriaceae bacterium]